MLTLLKSGEVYTPRPLGLCDILMAGNRIIAMEKELRAPKEFPVNLVNCSGYKVFPGLVDPVFYPCDNSDTDNPDTLLPAKISGSAFRAGITSAIGSLGWNDITREPGTLLRKVQILRTNGLQCHAYTGGFSGQSSVLLKNSAADLAYVSDYVATGIIGVTDHRAGRLSAEMLSSFHANAESGATLGNKSPVVVYMPGEESQQYDDFFLRIKRVIPMAKHLMIAGVNRNKKLMESARKFGMTGLINIAAYTGGFFEGEAIEATKALKYFLRAGVPIKNISISSFAGIEQHKTRNHNIEQQYTAFYDAFYQSICDQNIPTDIVTKIFSTNAARSLRLRNKGELYTGGPADILVATKDNLPVHLWGNGDILLYDKKVLNVSLNNS